MPGKAIAETREGEGAAPTPSPLAPPPLTSKLLEFVQQALLYKQLRKGINETLKLLGKDAVEAVLLAADADPPELLAPLPQVCEERGVPYCFVPHASSLGRACGIKRPVLCCCVVSAPGSPLQPQLQAVRDEVEGLFYA